MSGWKKHLSIFLLSVFCLALIPAPAFHSLFADHEDASANHCKFYHKELGRHLEEKETYCDLFQFNTPLYDAVGISNHFTRFAELSCRYTPAQISTRPLATLISLPLRAPPAA